MKIMNKIYSLTAIASAVLLMCSCGNDWLDLEPSTSISTDSSINAMQDCNASLNGIYSVMQNAYAYSGRLVYYGDAAGDDMQAYKVTSRTGDAYLFGYTASNVKTSYWEYPYALISACNTILNQVDKIETGDEDLRKYYKGQALALRGMFLFDLTRLFGYPYKKDNGASLGVPIITEVLDKDAKPSRNTVAQCYTQIIKDIKDGAELMNTKTGNAFHKGWINRPAALSLLSRVYLYHGDDALALSAAKDAMSAAKANKFALWTNSEYASAWGADVDESAPGETLFEIINLTDDSPGKEALGYLYDDYGYYDIMCTSSFYELLSSDSKDVRNSIAPISSKRTKRVFIKKYAPQGSEIIQDANIRLLRLSETYLNAAEAAMKTGDKKLAAEYLNAIVTRANPAKSVSEDEITLERIMTERRLELVGEGHRFFDALRDGGYVERRDVSIKAISSTKHLVMSDEKKKFNWNYDHCVLPIPISEIDANNNIDQNPGY
ncbi:MAG: RagB/SusD family nutrient uptake outer membrane protein [Bacteroidales bacterium]|nr:RagB/SusD family nutrient uptake outer membrane protein [Candidatus Cryptobacteroides onthequi]